MTESLELASAVMGRSTSLHEDRCGLPLGEQARECFPGQAVSLGDLAGVVGDGDFEHGLRQVYRDRRVLHLGLLLPLGVA
jgi:hypothetical protein